MTKHPDNARGLLSTTLYISLFMLCVLIVPACARTPPSNRSGLQAVTAVATLDTTNREALCAAVSGFWDRDWPQAIRALEALDSLQATCDDGEAPREQLYTALYTYGSLLEQRNRLEDAIETYETALVYNPVGAEATDALRRLNVYTPAPPVPCDPVEITDALAAVPYYTPTSGSFIRIAGSEFLLEDQRFPVYGVNYYPRDTPWRRFLTTTDIATVKTELDLLQQAGLNTMRIFLRHEPLFTCPGNGAVPVAETFTRLDSIIQEAAARGFRLIVTLNDLPDLSVHPLYDSPRYVDEQIVYIVSRYRDESAILAWDLRDGGDLDYLHGTFEKTAVLEWLTRTAILVRRADPNHLITASWRQEAEATIPAVDFVSVQHFEDVEALRQRLAVLNELTEKPILLSAVGYSTYQMDDISQRNTLQQALEAAENNGLAGWVIWTAFDYPLTATCIEPNCPSADSADHHFGLWNTSYFPKLTVDVIELMTGGGK
jgi:tetratricopeptide (TPR) repeat protein